MPLLNKAGGAGFQVTGYTQTWSDVEAQIGNRAKAGQIAGNFNTLIMLRVKELATAEMLTAQLPEVEINTLMQVSGVNDSSTPGTAVDFTSRNEDRLSVSQRPLITPADRVALPKGQAFALLGGGHLWKLRMPLPDPGHDPAMPANLDAIARDMARAYTTNETWFQDQLAAWAAAPGTAQCWPSPASIPPPCTGPWSRPNRAHSRRTFGLLAKAVVWPGDPTLRRPVRGGRGGDNKHVQEVPVKERTMIRSASPTHPTHSNRLALTIWLVAILVGSGAAHPARAAGGSTPRAVLLSIAAVIITLSLLWVVWIAWGNFRGWSLGDVSAHDLLWSLLRATVLLSVLGFYLRH